MSNTIDFEQQDKEYIANTYGRFNVCFEKGKGSLLWDVNGKEYIDLGSGIGVTAFGVDDDEWTEAVTKQSHALNTFQIYTILCRKLNWQNNYVLKQV